MDFKINIDYENKIIYYKHNGVLKVKDIEAAWKKLLSFNEFTEQKYNLFSDYTDAVFDMAAENIDYIINRLTPIKDILYNKKQVLLLKEPKSIALSIVFEEDIKKKFGFNTKVFTTKRAALNWIMND